MLLKSGASDLPTRWDSREHGWVTPVRLQDPLGTCWTFASCAALEVQLLKEGHGEYDLSEKNMVNLHGYELSGLQGGALDMAAAYLLRWSGAVAESNDVYEVVNNSLLGSDPMVPAVHVQNVIWVPARDDATDNDDLKAAIKDYGAVATSLWWDNSCEKGGTYYRSSTYSDPNHAVTVIGWDDEYPASNFKQTSPPPGDGAWLIKNSWGKGRGDNGFFYVSYHEGSFATAEDGNVFIPATEDEDYTAVYGYDKLGYVGYYLKNGFDLDAATFTSNWNEELAAIGVYSFSYPLAYTISIYTNVTKNGSSPISGGTLAWSQSGSLTYDGYTTLHLENPVKLADGTTFTVVFKRASDMPYHFLSYSLSGYSKCDNQFGATFIGSSTSGEWKDAASITGLRYQDVGSKPCVCLKAYTRSTVPASDGPEETDSGKRMSDELKTANATLYAETGETFGAFANLVGANGRTLWSSWLAGFDPADKNDNKLVVDISVTNNVPYLSWTPNLGADRSYRIWGSETLDEEEWEEVGDLKTTGAKFFKVTVEQ